jgi:hypothetical protein
MESDKIKILLEKYFEGNTTLAEEKELKTYFSSATVATELLQYQPLFAYFSQEKEQEFPLKMATTTTNKHRIVWWSAAASVIVLFGIGSYVFLNNNPQKATSDLGTYDDPEVAFRETQKALALLSNHVNVGIESVQYVETYENTRDKIFIIK